MPPGVAMQTFSAAQQATRYREGVWSLLAVYILWGTVPLYWRQLGHIPPLEVLAHRYFWGVLLGAFLLSLQKGGWGEIRDTVKDRRSLLLMVACSMAHMFSWGLYIWAVSAGKVLDLSLGYYILPLLSVVAGYLAFSERPRPLQWGAIALAACGVLGMVLFYGSFPWIGLLLAISACAFAVLRKHVAIGATPGLVLELLLPAPLFWGYLIWLHATGQGATTIFFDGPGLLLIGAGILTVLPQMGYAYGLTRVPLTTLSLMQYILPTGKFMVGFFLFHEAFTRDKAFGFTLIWAGVLLFVLEGYRAHRQIAHAARQSTEAFTK